MQENQTKIQLWSPYLSFLFSYLCTCIFSTIIIQKNWETLGNEKMIKQNKKWMIFGIITLVFTLICPFIGILPYIVYWNVYFGSVYKQAKFIKEQNIDFEKKSYMKPFLIGIVGTAIYVIALAVSILLWLGVFIAISEPPIG